MTIGIAGRSVRRLWLIVTMVILQFAAVSEASDIERGPTEVARPQAMQVDAGSYGVLDESFRYHRGAPGPGPGDALQARTGPLGSWYGYGFAGKTHRWGWFGAEHYYPRVLWHRGYYRDHFRWSYRRGY